MEMTKIRKMSVEQLTAAITQEYTELKNIRDAIRTGKEKDASKSLKIRRNIARMLTVLNEGSAKSETAKSENKKK